MTTKGTFIIYLSLENEDGLLIKSDDEPAGRYTRVLLESYSWDPDKKVKVGDRLKKYENVGQWQRKVIPDEWVVASVEAVEPSEYSLEFSKIVLAHCERQLLSPKEVEERSYVVEVKRPAFV
ncbi:MAG: hypothetical protein ACFCBU_10615 [Cyanophyceae cyanobacterium]